MPFSFKKIFLISLMVISITSVSLILIRETKAGCGIGCWVMRTCKQPHDETTCSGWSEPYGCHIVCEGGGGGSGPGSAGGSGSSGGGGGGAGSGSSSSSSQNSFIPTQVNPKDCSLESVDLGTGKTTPICKFPLPEHGPSIFGGIPLTGPTTQLNINFSGTLPSHLRSACTEGMTVLNNFFTENQIPLHINTDSTGEGNISIAYDDPGEGYEKSEAATETTPPLPSQRLGKSKVTFNLFYKGNDDTSFAGYVNQTHTCIHEVIHALGLSDVISDNADPYHTVTMGPGLSKPLEASLRLDFCTQAALTYVLKYGSGPFKRDVPCVGDPRIIKKLDKWLKGAIK